LDGPIPCLAQLIQYNSEAQTPFDLPKSIFRFWLRAEDGRALKKAWGKLMEVWRRIWGNLGKMMSTAQAKTQPRLNERVSDLPALMFKVFPDAEVAQYKI
jgi:hypothetical protein